MTGEILLLVAPLDVFAICDCAIALMTELFPEPPLPKTPVFLSSGCVYHKSSISFLNVTRFEKSMYLLVNR